eukprot:3128123-Rhodomonas_salina.1
MLRQYRDLSSVPWFAWGFGAPYAPSVLNLASGQTECQYCTWHKVRSTIRYVSTAVCAGFRSIIRSVSTEHGIGVRSTIRYVSTAQPRIALVAAYARQQHLAGQYRAARSKCVGG